MVEDRDVVIVYRIDGVDAGFLAEHSKEFVFKPDRNSAMVVPAEWLKNRLRELIKTKQARIVRTNNTEAVSVPLSKLIYS